MSEEKKAPVPIKKPVQPEWLDAADHATVKQLKDAFGDAVLDAKEYAGELTLWLECSKIAEICSHMKEKGFTYLVDLVGVHYPENEKPFTVVYYLHNMETQERVRFKVETTEEEGVPTVTGVWKTSNWMEREAWDLVGITFAGHPDLRRILTWEGFNGHPLRKDFPIEGIDTGAAIYPDTYPEGGGPTVEEEPKGKEGN